MSTLAHKAVSGAIWTIGASVSSRLIGVIGTLLLTHFLAPDVVGEVGVATVLVLTVNVMANVGFGPYVLATNAGREASFHATVFTLGLSALGLGLLLVLAAPLAPFFDAPTMAQYVPGLVGANLLQNTGFLASRILARDMRFRVVGLGLAAGEIAYTGVSVGLAAAGWGGDAIVLGNVARGLSLLLIYGLATDRRDWLEPHRLTWSRTREIFHFGFPLWIGSIAHFASRRWDNLLFSRIFGPAELGLYNLAYNLADIPTTQVGEHIGDVLLPSYARMDEPGRRKWALMRATSLMALVVFPLAVGLGAIAPTLVAVLFNEEWQGVAPLLVILSVLSVVRPVSWVIGSYLIALHHTRAVMLIEILKVFTLLAAVSGLGMFGPLWACAGVGLAFGLASLASLWAVRKSEKIPMWRMARGMLGPLLACAPMAAAVVGVRHLLDRAGYGASMVSLVSELAVGAVIYVIAAFVFAPGIARDFLGLVKNVLLRRGGGDDDD